MKKIFPDSNAPSRERQQKRHTVRKTVTRVIRLYKIAKTFSAAANVFSISTSPCADETNPASNADGARYTPSFNIAWKNFLNLSTSQFFTSANVSTTGESVKKQSKHSTNRIGMEWNICRSRTLTQTTH